MNLGRCKVTLGLSAWKMGISVFLSHDASSCRAPSGAPRARGRGISKHPSLPHPVSFSTIPSPPCLFFHKQALLIFRFA
jgi:hypothetical protein